MAESGEKSGFSANVTTSHSGESARHIRSRESDAPDLELAARIKEIVGDEAGTSFSEHCGFSEGMLRKYLKGAKPKPRLLANMANYKGVMIEWLATGQGPKTRADLRAAQSQSQVHAGGEPVPAARIDPALLRQCLAACTMVYGAPFAAAAVARQVEHAADLYNAMLPNVGPRLTLQDIASREPAGLAEMLRGFLALGAVRPFS